MINTWFIDVHEQTFLLTDALELLSRVGFQRAQISHLIGTKCTIDRSEMKLEQIKWTLHEYRNWIWKVPDLKNNLKWTTTTEPFKFLRQSCHDFLHLPHLKRILQYFHNAAKFLNRRSLKRVIINAKLPSVKTICDVDCELGAPKVCPRPSFGRSSKSSHVLPTYLGWLIQKPDAHLSLQRYKMSI